MYTEDCKSRLNETLYVIAAVSNPWRYHSRYALYYDFEKHMAESGVKLLTVELAYGRRLHAVTQPDNPWHVQVRSPHELWHKENLINLGIQRLPPDWRYVAWIDADVTFARPDWAMETLQRLQHYHVVQLFGEAQDLSPDSEPLQRHKGFGWCYCELDEEVPDSNRPAVDCYGPPIPGRQHQRAQYVKWHPGFAWAARREAIDALGGLIDFAPLGSADNHMAKALVGTVHRSHHPGVTANYSKWLDEWQYRALKYIRKNIGYVPGLLLHNWHGKKKDRRYWDRWRILVDNAFDPETDIKRDWQGVWQLTDRTYDVNPDRSVGLRDGIRNYFRTRNEDSIDVDVNGMA
jgi:hypothetical protein